VSGELYSTGRTGCGELAHTSQDLRDLAGFKRRLVQQ